MIDAAPDVWGEIDQLPSPAATPSATPPNVWDEIDRTIATTPPPPTTVGKDYLVTMAQRDVADEIPGATHRLAAASALPTDARVPFSRHSDPVDVAAAAMHADPSTFESLSRQAATAARHRGQRPDIGDALVRLANSAPPPASPAPATDVWAQIDQALAPPAPTVTPAAAPITITGTTPGRDVQLPRDTPGLQPGPTALPITRSAASPFAQDAAALTAPAPTPPATPTAFNPKTGRRTPVVPFGASPIDIPAQGVLQAATGVKELAQAATVPQAPVGTPGTSTFVNPKTGRASAIEPIGQQTMVGASDLMEGAGKAASPLLVGGAVAAPLETATLMAASKLAGTAAAGTVKAAGGSPEAQRAAGDLAATLVVVPGADVALARARDAAVNLGDAAAASTANAARSAILAAKLRLPNFSDALADAAHAGTHAPIEAMEHIGGADAPPTVGETLGEAVKTALAPEPPELHYEEGPDRSAVLKARPTADDVWNAVDAVVGSEAPRPAEGPSSPAPPVAVRPGESEAAGPVAPSPEPSPAAPAVAAPPADVWDQIDHLDTGEQQPRLPGDVGAVREQERPTPAEEAPFALTPQVAERGSVQPTLREEAPATKHDFSSTQVQLPAEHAAAIRALGASIPDDHLADDGREDDAHVTVKYGLHTNDVEDVRNALAGEPPIRLALGKTSLFTGADSGKDYDVVKADIESQDLHRLNAKIAAALEHTDTHPTYKPHATIAYVKAGLGQQYAGRTDLAGREAVIDRVTFSDKNGNKIEVPLTGGQETTNAIPLESARTGRFFGSAGPGDEGASAPVGEGNAGSGLLAATRAQAAEAPAAGQPAPQAVAPAASQRTFSKGLGPPNLHERRELGRMLQELQNWGFTKKTFNYDVAGQGGTPEIVGGAGGAPVFHDIMQGAGGTRSSAINAIQRVLAGKKPSALGQRALDVARVRLGAPNLQGLSVSAPILPPEAGNEAGHTYVESTPEMTADEAAAEQPFRQAIENRTPAMVTQYRRRFGHVVNADFAKELSPQYAASNTSKAALNRAVHRGSSALADAVYRTLLAEPAPAGKNAEVTFVAGPTGAGKTTVAKMSPYQEILHDSQIVVDGPLSAAGSAQERIQAALEAGKDVHILYVHREPVEAWKAVLARAVHEGRQTPLDYHVASHVGSLATIQTLARAYADDPRVHIEYVDNTNRAAPTLIQASDLPEAYTTEDVRSALAAAGHAEAPAAEQSESRGARPSDGGSGGDRAAHGAEERGREGVGSGRTHTSQEVAAPRSVPKTAQSSTVAPRRSIPVASRGGTTLQAAVVPGAKEFVEQDLTPAVKAAAARVGQAKAELRTLFAPDTMGDASRIFADVMRSGLAAHAQRIQKAQLDLRALEKAFDRLPPAQNLDFIDAVETGEVDRLPESERAAAQRLRSLLDGKRQAVRARGKLQSYIEHYFPHEWKQPSKTKDLIRQILGRRPLQGPKSFLKQRKIPTVKEGIAMGLEPASTNPVTLVLHKIAEMDKWIMAHDILKDAKALGVAKFVAAGMKAPEDWQRYHDSFGTVYAPPFVEVEEAFDARLMEKLHDFAHSLGVTAVRKVKIAQRGSGIGGNAWGYALANPDGSHTVATKFAGPETVLEHEIGHVLDWKYGLWDKIKKELDDERFDARERNPANELRALADLRFQGQSGVKGSFKKYVRQKDEKIANLVHAFIYNPDLAKQVAPNAYWALYNLAKDTPALTPLIDLQKTKSLVLGTATAQKRVPGTVIAGHYFGPAEATRLLNNYLSPGLRGNAAYDTYRQLGNFMNQVQLGLSGFHLGMTSVEAVVSKTAQAIEELSRGEGRQAARAALEAPVATFSTLYKGHKAMQALFAKDANTRTLEGVTDLVTQAGGGIHRDQTLKAFDNRGEAFVKALRQGNVVGAALRLPLAAIEAPTRFVMNWWVPRLKLGAYLDLARMELRTLGPEPDLAEARRVLGAAWDSIDNRFGQLVYDNLFWHNALKDLGMGSVRALGWNIGTIREMFGAPLAEANQIKALATGSGSGGKAPTRLTHTGYDADGRRQFTSGAEPWMTHQLAYVIALPIIVGLMGALYNYLHTGEAPQELRDYFQPRTGKLRGDGKPERVLMPSYFKDWYAFATNPAATVWHKAQPLLNSLVEMWQNEDYYGTQIRNPDDPLVKQATDTLLHEIPKPFAAEGFLQRRASGGSTGTSGLESFFGINPAPASVYRTKAEDLMRQYLPPSVKTQQQAEQSATERTIREGIRAHDVAGRDAARAAARTGTLSQRQLENAVLGSARTGLQAGFEHLTLPQALHVYQVATPQERAALWSLLERKVTSSLPNAAPAEIPALRREIQAATTLPRRAPLPITSRPMAAR